MPYTFTSWTACTDPAGNARTLDWSEAGMRGQPAAIYLEALRQAAALRAGVRAVSGATDPGALVLQPALANLPALLGYIDAVAWHTPATEAGWIDPAELTDFTGETAVGVMDSEAKLLAATTHAARIPKPAHVLEVISGAYLRQLRDMLRAKVNYSTGLIDGQVGDCYQRDSTGADWTAAAAAFAAASWNYVAPVGPGPFRAYHYSIDTAPTTLEFSRRAVSFDWQDLARGAPLADCYIAAGDYNGGWDPTDYAFPGDGQLLRVHTALDTSVPQADWLGHIDTASLPGGTGWHGWRIDSLLLTLDWTGWPLGA